MASVECCAAMLQSHQLMNSELMQTYRSLVSSHSPLHPRLQTPVTESRGADVSRAKEGSLPIWPRLSGLLGACSTYRHSLYPVVRVESHIGK